MVKEDIAYLIAEDPGDHGVFEPVDTVKRMVYVTVKSVGQQETYNAISIGLTPTFVFVLTDYSEYQGEKYIEYHNTKYSIFRTYVKDMAIEITAVEL